MFCLSFGSINSNARSAILIKGSRNQKRRAYDLVKTAFQFRLRLRRLRSAYDLVNTRLTESEAEVETNHKTWERAL